LVQDYPKPDPRRIAKAERPNPKPLATDDLQPNWLVRWAFYVSAFAIPFIRLYLPGTGDRLGVARLVQALILCAVLSQPRVCLRLMPTALFWFLAYCGVRVLFGLWLTPEFSAQWWPSTFGWIQFSIPWAWVMFNVLQFPGTGRNGLWALIAGASFCALLHIAGIGVVEVDKGIEGRSTVLGENANVVGVMYAVAMIALVGLGMLEGLQFRQRLLLLPLLAVVGAGLAKSGSRSAFLIFAMGVGVLLFQGRSLGSRTKRIASVLLVVALLAGIIWQIPTVMQRFEKLDSSNLQAQEGRVRMIPVLWEMFLRNPIHGSGPDGYQLELTRRAMPYLLKDQRLIVAHNLALRLLVETGIVGFLLFSSGVKVALISAWRARLKPCGSLPLALFLSLTIASIILCDPGYYLVFWFAMA
jgi:hypothetical protein